MDAPHPNALEDDEEDDVDVAQVIDLPIVTEAVGHLLDFYDRLLADDDPPISELDAAVARIWSLPPIPGRLGRDIALIARGGEGAGRGEIVAALERLRHLASMDPPQPEESESADGPARRRRKLVRPRQDRLPGLG